MGGDFALQAWGLISVLFSNKPKNPFIFLDLLNSYSMAIFRRRFFFDGTLVTNNPWSTSSKGKRVHLIKQTLEVKSFFCIFFPLLCLQCVKNKASQKIKKLKAQRSGGLDTSCFFLWVCLQGKRLHCTNQTRKGSVPFPSPPSNI